MKTLKYSPANAKTQALYAIPELQRYLRDRRKVYSQDLLSGHFCPYAKDCLSRAELYNKLTGRKLSLWSKFVKTAKRIVSTRIVDGPHTQFRCFSASQEAQYHGVFKLRRHNSQILKHWDKTVDRLEMSHLIERCMPENLGILRIHVSGDFFSQKYFDAMALIARRNPDKLFYGYTKSLPFWTSRLGQLTDNFVLTASRGGHKDILISQYGLREAKVVYSVDEAERLKLEIDHDDSHAANPFKRYQSFALLIHGTQPPGTKAVQAVKMLQGIGSYKRGAK